ncbi:MAG: PilZ domain-containing protein [Nitrosomonadales bacterium]|nr:PilZ domain-containing protein [Nitrosomonadales bacterium]
MRQFIRHPADIPIEAKAVGQQPHATHHAFNLSVGGLAFRCDSQFMPGDVVAIRIPLVRPPFEAEARVAWCRARNGRPELGVEFLDQDDAYMARMVEQVCHIENYKQKIFQTEGRLLSPDEAAREWINKYAARFPDAEDAQ